MKNNPTYRSSCLMLLALAALILTSCIKEDLSKCPQPVMGLSIVFNDLYGADDFYAGLNTDELSQVSIFVYDQKNRLIATTDLYECRLDQEYATDLELPAGSYNLVVWSGTQALYYIFDQVDDLYEASLSLWIPEDHIIDYWVSHLYYGRSAFELNSTIAVVHIPMIQYTNDINFTVRGLDDKDRYMLSIVDNNGKYTFNNSYLPCEYFEYHSGTLFFEEGQFKTWITILRLMDGFHPMFSLTDEVTGEVLYPRNGQPADVIEVIKKAYEDENFDFDSRHIFDFSLEFDINMNPTLFINGWEVKEDKYEI